MPEVLQGGLQTPMAMKELVFAKKPRLYDAGGDLRLQWYISYYCTHPITGQLQRFKCSKGFSRLKTLSGRYAHAQRRIQELEKDLLSGIHPYFKDKLLPTPSQKKSLPTGMKEVEKMLRNAIPAITTSTKEKTLRTYQGYLNYFLLWMGTKSINNQNLGVVSEHQANEYLDWLAQEKNLAIKTRNDHLTLLRNIFDYLLRQRKCTENPFLHCKFKKHAPVHRRQYREHIRIPILSYLQEQDPTLLLYIKMIFYTMRRNEEIKQLLIGDIDLMEGVIEIRPEIGKTDQPGNVQIPRQLYDELKSLQLHRFPREYFLFGKGGLPGPEAVGKNFFYKRWRKVREVHHLPQDLGIYNWKHTGVILGIKSRIPENEIKNQAGWKTRAMIDVYSKDMDPLEEGTIRNEMPSIDSQKTPASLYHQK